MTNVCITRFHSIPRKASAPFGRHKKHGCKKYFTLPSYLSTSNAVITRPSSALIVCYDQFSFDTPQLSDQWFAIRRDKLTSSSFSTALGFFKGKRRPELWHEKVFVSNANLTDSSNRAMEWGLRNEAAAIEQYRSITGSEIGSLGFAIHSDERFHWLGASPDGLLGSLPSGGILEVKCPYNKGKPASGLPWSAVPFYYMPQVQGQMEIMNREWVHLYCWMPNGSALFLVGRDRSYWKLIRGMLCQFWWENVVPARKTLSMGGKEEDAALYKPQPTHRMTGLAIVKSLELAAEAKLLWRDVAGHTEFYS